MNVSDQGIELIKRFEGLELTAYPDPGTGGDPWTIGYGTTRGVTQGMRITEEEAEAFLIDDLIAFERAVMTLIPLEMTQGEFDALVSFVYNVGPAALEESTLRRRLLAGEPRCWVYQKELPRWNKGGNGVLEGLVRRRQAEADLACLGYLSGPAEELSKGVEKPVVVFPLGVPYFYQRDSKTGHGERMCFSSAMAMAMDYINPDAILGDDDWYLNEVFKFGDSVSSTAQVAAAESLGFTVDFRTDASEKDLLEQLDRGIPVPVGILHHGNVDQPTGGGHWICLIGYDDTHFHVHDPFGELSLVSGGYPKAGPTDGKDQRYTRKNLMKRWLITNDNDGWGCFFR
jgi:GH24 family phage-related lysozyme (muramidase)